MNIRNRVLFEFEAGILRRIICAMLAMTMLLGTISGAVAQGLPISVIGEAEASDRSTSARATGQVPGEGVLEGDNRYNSMKLTSYLKISMEKYGNTISASSTSESGKVTVLEYTKWQMKAEYVEVMEESDGSTSNSKIDVTSKCTWSTSAPSSVMSVSESGLVSVFGKSRNAYTIKAAYKGRVITYSSDGTYQASDKMLYAAIEFTAIGLSIRSEDADVALYEALSYLTSYEWSAMSSNTGKTVKTWAEAQLKAIVSSEPSISGGTNSSITTGYLHISSMAKKNSARVLHFLLSAAGDCSIEQCFDNTSRDLRAVVFRLGSTRYVSYGLSRVEAEPILADAFKKNENDGRRRFSTLSFDYNSDEVWFDLGMSVYNRQSGTADNTVVIGRYYSGIIAKYVSYMTGCRAVTFNTPSPLQYIFCKKFEELCKYYSVSRQINYNDSIYNAGSGNTVYRYEPTSYIYTNYDCVLHALSYSTSEEMVSIPHSSVNTYKELHLWNRDTYLGNEEVDTYDDKVEGKLLKLHNSVFFGGGGPDYFIQDQSDFSDIYSLVSGLLNVKSFTDVIQFLRKKERLKALKVGIGQIPGWIYDGVFHSFFDVNLIVGGKGNDIIHSSMTGGAFCYTYGDGEDTYFLKGGNNDIYLMGCDEKNVTIEGPSMIGNRRVVLIKIDGSVKITADLTEGGLRYFLGSLRVHYGSPFDKTAKTTEVLLQPQQPVEIEVKDYDGYMIYYAGCPVDVLVYDDEGNVVQTLRDGTEYEAVTEYGIFKVKYNDGEYRKALALFYDQYEVRIHANDDGVMDFSSLLTYFDEGENDACCMLKEIPIKKGAIYYVSKNTEEGILKVDENGDGTIDYTIGYNTTVQFGKTAYDLPYGEQLVLSPEATSPYGDPEVTFISDDMNVVMVDEEGLVTAVGFGSAKVYAYALDGSGAYGCCTVTVAEETLSVADCTVTGMKEAYDYTGEPIQVELGVTYHSLHLIGNVDYTADFSDLLNPGNATLTITGIGRYSGILTIPYTINASTQPETVSDKVSWIMNACQSAGVTGEWETALWLHDWLIYNADYDYTYTYYSADGVLLKGTGVCQSYSEAYRLLLNKAGIENRLIVSGEMDHAWNLVKIDGKWCHIDCTWDDPGFGGAENHTYFGMNTALMGRDHQWGASGHPACDSLNNYYPLRMGLLCFSDESELTTIMAQQSALRANPVTLVYVGADPSETALSAFSKWYASYNWKYGLRSYGASYSDYSCTLQIEYTDPWEQPENHLFEPVPAPAFALDSPEGRYSIGNYSNNGIVLVFGRDGCMNTAGLFDRLEQELPKLNEGGIEVLAVVENAAAPEDLVNLKRDYDSFHYTYDDPSLVWKYLGAVGYEGEYLTYPCVFVINSDQMITYYSTGYVFNMDELIGEAFATATGRALPWPEKHVDITPMLNGTGNVNAMRQGVTLVPTLKSASTDNHVILVVCNTLWYAAEQQLQFYERHHRAFEKLGVKLIASFLEIAQEDKDAFPHCTFVDLTMDDFWAIQYGLGYQGGSVSYLTCLMAEKGGRIAAYTSGDTLKLSDCLVYFARGIQYDATIPSGLTAIEAEVFSGTAFRRLDLGGGALQSIGAGAFANCDPEIVRIPETVESIGEGAFSGDPIVICTIGTAGHVYAQTHGLDYVCE